MPVRETNPEGARELIDSGDWKVLDVRTEPEFRAGHVPGAANVPVFFRGPGGMAPNPDFVAGVRERFQPGDGLVVFCAAGMRSGHACELLAAEGFEKLVNVNGGMSGGYDASGAPEPGWIDRDYPVTREG